MIPDHEIDFGEVPELPVNKIRTIKNTVELNFPAIDFSKLPSAVKSTHLKRKPFTFATLVTERYRPEPSFHEPQV